MAADPASRSRLQLVPTSPAPASSGPAFGPSTDAPSFAGVQALPRRRRRPWPRLPLHERIAIVLICLAALVAVLIFTVLYGLSGHRA